MGRSWTGFLLAGVIVGLAPQPLGAQPFGLTQITNTTGGVNSGLVINADGTRIAFQSNRDLTPGSPGNADGNQEIFLFDSTTGLITQITNTTGGGFANSEPSIDAAGTKIAFSSNRDLTPGNPGNADGNKEIFLFDTTTGLFTQITDTTGGFGNLGARINAAGTRIVFASDRDLAPGSPGNADGNAEAFLVDITTGLFTQITNTTGSGAAGGGSINADGTRIAFVSDHDLTPGSPGNADRNTEIFLFNATTATLTQITNTIGGFFQGPTTGPANFGPSINAAGNRIAFVSNRDLTPGSPGNADGNAEIFLFDTTTGLFTQITDTRITNNTADGNRSPSIDAAGTRIAFASNRDLTPGSPGNADGNAEIFLFDTTTGLFTQITTITGFSGSNSPSINAAGTRIAFASNSDLTPGSPGNADGNDEIFLASSSAPTAAPIPTLSQSLQLVLTALLVVGGLYRLRRRAGRNSRPLA